MMSDNIAEVLREIQRIEHKGIELKPVFARIANHLQNITEDAFEDEKSPLDNSQWQPLSEATLKRKKGDKKLYDKGHMQRGLVTASSETGAMIGFNATSDDGYPYPAVHQFGTDDEKIPARPFLPFDERGDITPSAKASILEFVVAHFE